MSVSEGREYVGHAAAICESLGINVFVPARETCRPWDMIANGKKVQVKKRGVCTSKPNNVRLVTAYGAAKAVYSTKDFDVLALHWKGSWYVAPVHVFAKPCGSLRNGIYMPSIAEWINKWGILSGDYQSVSIQKQFDF